MKKETVIFLVLAIFLTIVGFFSIRKMVTATQANRQKMTSANNNINYRNTQKEEGSMPASLSANRKMNKPNMIINQNKKYEAVLHTSAGDITIALSAQTTPITVNNFVALAKDKFYDGTIFHRVIKGFMIQGGDPRGDGTGGPGYKFDDEKFTGEYTRGTVAMANAGPNTNGSQFFIMHQDYGLQPNYVIFGKVVAGIEVVDQIANAKVGGSFSGEMSKPVEPVTVKSVDIVEK